MSSHPSNPNTHVKTVTNSTGSESFLPALKRLVLGLEPDCAKILPLRSGTYASTRLVALFSLAARGIVPSKVGRGEGVGVGVGGGGEGRQIGGGDESQIGGGALIIKLLAERFADSFSWPLEKCDETPLAAHCCAFLSSWQDLPRDQCAGLVEAFEKHLTKACRHSEKGDSTTARQSFLVDLAKSCLATGWAHEYLSERNNSTLLTRTQFFTPSWIAAYLCCQAIAGKETFTMLDPACGAGHLLVQAVHEATSGLEQGALKSRLEELFAAGLFGLDLDAELIDLAAFALYLTARDRLGESRHPEGKFTDLPAPHLFCLPGPLGSLALAGGGRICDSSGRTLVIPKTFDALVMNPPYLSTRTMDDTTAAFLKEKFPGASGDLYTAFLQLSMGLLSEGGRLSTIVQQSFLSISRYRWLRLDMLKNFRFISCVQLGTGAFPSRPGEKVNNAIITLLKPPADKSQSEGRAEPHAPDHTAGESPEKSQEDEQEQAIKEASGQASGQVQEQDLQQAQEQSPPQTDHWIYYLRLHGKGDHDLVQAAGLANYPHQSILHSDAVALINSLSGQPFAFHCPAEIAALFDNQPSLAQLKDDFVLTNGLFTCDNGRFVKLADSLAADEKDDYVPYDKGGGKKWYHKTPYCLRWGKNGEEVREFRATRGQSRSLPGESFYFQPGLTYSYIGTRGFSARLLSHGAAFDIASSAVFSLRHDLHYVLGFFNSALVAYLLSILNPTINFQIGDLRRLPFKEPMPELAGKLSALCTEAVGIAKTIEEAAGNGGNTGPGQAKEMQALVGREGQIQNEIDTLVFDHYGLSKRARSAVLDDPWVKRSQRPIN